MPPQPLPDPNRESTSSRMSDGPITLMLDSLAIGIVFATIVLEAFLLLDSSGTGRVLGSLGPVALTLIWMHLSVFSAPLGTLILLARGSR